MSNDTALNRNPPAKEYNFLCMLYKQLNPYAYKLFWYIILGTTRDRDFISVLGTV